MAKAERPEIDHGAEMARLQEQVEAKAAEETAAPEEAAQEDEPKQE